MKKKTIIYASPDSKAMEVRVRSVIATSLVGSSEGYEYEPGITDDEHSGGTEGYGTIGGEW